MKIIIFFFPLLLACVGIACAPVRATPSPTLSVEDIVSATLTAIVETSAGPDATPTIPAPDEVSPAWLSEPDGIIGKTFPAYLSGLVYRDNSVWLVDNAGVSHLVMGQPINGTISPDGTGYLYSSSMNNGEDILYFNMASGDVTQFTHTPDIFERDYQWWPGRSNVIVFNFIPEAQLGPWSGYLGAYEISNSETIIIDGDYGSASTFALSPDGEKIAYLQETQPAIYTWGGGSARLDMASFGLPFTDYRTPAWSPDSTQLAFFATGAEKDGGVQAGIVIVDLIENTAQVIHEFISYGMRVLPEIVFSPDGQWLVSVNPGEITADGNPVTMWVYQIGGTEKINLGYASSPFWQPGGDYLLYTAWPDVGNTEPHRIMIAERGLWQPTAITELQGAFISDWINLP